MHREWGETKVHPRHSIFHKNKTHTSRHRILHIQIMLETHLNLRHTLINAESTLVTGLASTGSIYFLSSLPVWESWTVCVTRCLLVLAQSYYCSAYCSNIKSLDKIMEWILLEDTLKHAEDRELFRHRQHGYLWVGKTLIWWMDWEMDKELIIVSGSMSKWQTSNKWCPSRVCPSGGQYCLFWAAWPSGMCAPWKWVVLGDI